MPTRRTIAAVAFGLLSLAVVADLSAASKEKEADKYAKILKTSKDPKARALAVSELGKLGQIQKSLVEPALPDMMTALEDKDAGVRAAAAHAIGMVEPDPKVVVPVLVKLLKEDPADEVKIGAAQGLGSMGSGAKAAVKDLREVKMYETKDKEKKMMTKVGRAAQQAMRSINMKKEE